ncbi:MAG TPA: tetratricopeptide repeat protein [Moraxellaceae bacterium]
MERIEKKKWLALVATAAKGDAEAQWTMGYYHEYGVMTLSRKVLVFPNKSEAMHWYMLAAEQDYYPAQGSLSNILSEGDQPDYPAAIRWAKAAIKLGDASSAYNLGIIYRDMGKPKAAFRYYQLAATMGHFDAHLQIGLCYLLGHGVATDHAAAQACFRKILQADANQSRQRSREDAQYWLALLNLMGLGQRRNLGQAREMLELANADDDHEMANDLLNVIGRSVRSGLR